MQPLRALKEQNTTWNGWEMIKKIPLKRLVSIESVVIYPQRINWLEYLIWKIFFLSIITALSLLQPIDVLAATQITGTITAKHGETVKVEFQAHKAAGPKIGDEVKFSTIIDGIFIPAGIGKVTEVDGITVWIKVENMNLKPKMKAVIYATGMPDSHVNEADSTETTSGEAVDSRIASKPPVIREEPLLVLSTSEGTISIELNEKKAPETVKNIMNYASEGFYDGTIFHRVIKGFMIQGGGFTTNMQKKKTNAPIKNEADNGLKNLRGTVAMARTKDPHSASSQFFINTGDNDFLDFKSKNKKGWGYCVFGKVIDGMEVVDAIELVKTTNVLKYRDVPVKPVIIRKVYIK